ncbi:hypothetical protein CAUPRSCDRAFT_12215, partial [Caulochytrium protostelioides]
ATRGPAGRGAAGRRKPRPHGVRLATGGLAVGEDRRVVSLKKLMKQRPRGCLVDVGLGMVGPEAVVVCERFGRRFELLQPDGFARRQNGDAVVALQQHFARRLGADPQGHAHRRRRGAARRQRSAAHRAEAAEVVIGRCGGRRGIPASRARAHVIHIGVHLHSVGHRDRHGGDGCGGGGERADGAINRGPALETASAGASVSRQRWVTAISCGRLLAAGRRCAAASEHAFCLVRRLLPVGAKRPAAASGGGPHASAPAARGVGVSPFPGSAAARRAKWYRSAAGGAIRESEAIREDVNHTCSLLIPENHTLSLDDST